MSASREQDPRREAESLERKADALRQGLGELVGELDHRRHALARRLAPIGIVAAALTVAGGIGYAVWARHRRRSWSSRARMTAALRRMREHPERVAKETPNVGKKIAAAALTTLASLAVKRAFAAALPERGRTR